MIIRIIDFGLVVLIWLVQLVIYPGFKYYQPEDLLKWHNVYTGAITLVVMPLMLSQLLLHALCTYAKPSVPTMVMFVCVIGTWLITFFYAVPLHDKISTGNDLQAISQRLIAVNWYRTVLWTMVFILGMIALPKNPTLWY